MVKPTTMLVHRHVLEIGQPAAVDIVINRESELAAGAERQSYRLWLAAWRNYDLAALAVR